MRIRRIVVLVALGLLVWQALRLVPLLFRRPASHQVVVVNEGRRTLETVHLRIGGRRFDGGPVAGRDSIAFAFRVARDVPIDLTWAWADRPEEDHAWHGGRAPYGPMVQRFRIAVRDDGGVVYRVTSAPKPAGRQSR